MVTNHDVWDAVAMTDGTPANSFEFLVALNYGGAWHTTADVTNVNPSFTAKVRTRSTYAAKGKTLGSKYGTDLALSFDIEAIRDANGQYQADLTALLAADRAVGSANRMRIRIYDALGADYAFEADFTISVSRTNTGSDDAGFFTVTAAQYGDVTWIANPTLVGNVPIVFDVRTANSAPAATGSTVYIQGDNFTGATLVKFSGTNATSQVVVNDSLITAVVPAGAAGVTAVTVVSPAGTSPAYNYTRAA